MTTRNVPKTILEIVKYLSDANLFPIEPDNLSLVIDGDNEELRKPGYHNNLDLSQLEEAANTGSFWFPGSVNGIRIRIDKGVFRGGLLLGLHRMSHNTRLSPLDCDDFTKMTEYLTKVASMENLKIAFQESKQAKNDFDLVLTYDAPLSVENSVEFLDKISKMVLSFR
ncbi:MAG: hypothetical protein ACE5KO_00315 [Candidatus Bathyarchaeia archaeon]